MLGAPKERSHKRCVPACAPPAAGASLGGDLAQPHSQAYLILYPLLFLGARTATWAAARQLSTQRCAQRAFGGEAGAAEAAQPALPQELLPLTRGAWLLKLPSGGGSGGWRGGGLNAAGDGWGCAPLAAPGAQASCGGGVGRRRFVQLSLDGACLRWDWRRWVLCHHVQALHAW